MSDLKEIREMVDILKKELQIEMAEEIVRHNGDCLKVNQTLHPCRNCILYQYCSTPSKNITNSKRSEIMTAFIKENCEA